MTGMKDIMTRKGGSQNPSPQEDRSGYGKRENWRPSESVKPEADVGPEPGGKETSRESGGDGKG